MRIGCGDIADGSVAGLLPGLEILSLVAPLRAGHHVTVYNRTRAHAVIGLINSAPRIPGASRTGATREVLNRMALGAIGLPLPRLGSPL